MHLTHKPLAYVIFIPLLALCGESFFLALLIGGTSYDNQLDNHVSAALQHSNDPNKATVPPMTFDQLACAKKLKTEVRTYGSNEFGVTIFGDTGCLIQGSVPMLFSTDAYGNKSFSTAGISWSKDGSFTATSELVSSTGAQLQCGHAAFQILLGDDDDEFPRNVTFYGDNYPANLRVFAPLPSPIKVDDPNREPSDCQ